MLLQNKKRYLEKDIKKIGFLDIETQGQGFSANKSYLISWVLQEYNIKTGKTITWYDIVNKTQLKKSNKRMFKDKKMRTIRPYDREILKTLIPKMREMDLIVTHFGTWFDIPMIRTRAKMQNIPFIKHSEKIRFADTWKFSKVGLKLDRNTLDLASKTLNVPQRKTKVDYFWWQMATLGVPKALKYVLKHNILDVEVTKKLFFKTEMDYPIASRYF